MARSRYRFDEPHRPHFLTCTVVEWLPVFTREEAVQIVLDTWRYQQAHDGLKLYGFVILENHLHAIAQAEALLRVWAQFKSYSARKLLTLLEEAGAKPLLELLAAARKAKQHDRSYQFWQEGSHPQVLLDLDMLRQKLEYIHNNPVKRGYVDAPEDWRWSSARSYAGRAGVLEVYRDWGLE